MFEEVGIGFVGDAAIGFMRRLHALGWAGWPGRPAWWRILPEAAVFEDFADDALMGFATSNGRTCKRKQFGYGNSSSSECILAKHSLPKRGPLAHPSGPLR